MSMAIELLEEHRTAPLSAAVTGKINVRQYAGKKIPRTSFPQSFYRKIFLLRLFDIYCL